MRRTKKGKKDEEEEANDEDETSVAQAGQRGRKRKLAENVEFSHEGKDNGKKLQKNGGKKARKKNEVTLALPRQPLVDVSETGANVEKINFQIIFDYMLYTNSMIRA